MQRRHVHICETDARDGLQNLPTFVPTAAKCALMDAIAASGAPEIDAGSFVPAKIVPQFADVDAVVARVYTQCPALLARAQCDVFDLRFARSDVVPLAAGLQLEATKRAEAVVVEALHLALEGASGWLVRRQTAGW